MATIVYFDSEVSAGGRDGTTPATAYNNSDFSTYNFSKGTDYEFRFANGSTFTFGTAQKSVTESAGNLKFTNYDRGDAHRTLPTFTRMIEYAGSPTWTEIDATDAIAGSYTASPGSKLWHCSGITGFIGAYLDDNGDLAWGHQCDVSDVSGSGADAPDEQGDWCNDAGGALAGLMIYSDTNPNTYYAQGSRAIMAGVESNHDWKFTRPIGGLEMENLRFEKCGNPICVANATAATLVSGVHLHDLEFSGVERCFAINGSGSMSDGAGFTGLIIERCRADNLGAQFVATPNGGVALDDSEIRFNIVKGSNRKISSGIVYLSNCYSTDGTGVIVHHNWLHDTEYGNYWKNDGYPLYSELNCRDVEWCYNLVTGSKRAALLKGPGRNLFHHNWMFAGSESTTNDPALVATDTAENDVHDKRLDIYQNVSVGFACFLTDTCNYTTYPDGRLGVYRNIASGLATNSSCNPIRTRGTTTETHINVRQNNFFGFWATGSITWKEYDGGTTTLTHTQADTSTTDNTALLADWPEPDPASTRNHALKLPAGITAAGATRGTTQVNAPCLAPA